jgi:hypothetical protein
VQEIDIPPLENLAPYPPGGTDAVGPAQHAQQQFQEQQQLGAQQRLPSFRSAPAQYWGPGGGAQPGRAASSHPLALGGGGGSLPAPGRSGGWTLGQMRALPGSLSSPLGTLSSPPQRLGELWGPELAAAGILAPASTVWPNSSAAGGGAAGSACTAGTAGTAGTVGAAWGAAETPSMAGGTGSPDAFQAVLADLLALPGGEGGPAGGGGLLPSPDRLAPSLPSLGGALASPAAAGPLPAMLGQPAACMRDVPPATATWEPQPGRRRGTAGVPAMGEGFAGAGLPRSHESFHGNGGMAPTSMPELQAPDQVPGPAAGQPQGAWPVQQAAGPSLGHSLQQAQQGAPLLHMAGPSVWILPPTQQAQQAQLAAGLLQAQQGAPAPAPAAGTLAPPASFADALELLQSAQLGQQYATQVLQPTF